jgi:hypothetical protein
MELDYAVTGYRSRILLDRPKGVSSKGLVCDLFSTFF